MKTCTRCRDTKSQWNFTTGQTVCRVCKRIDNHNQRAKKAGSVGTFTTQEWKALCESVGMQCQRCHRNVHYEQLTMDHIQPLKKGGANTINNLQPLCSTCNTSKSNRE